MSDSDLDKYLEDLGIRTDDDAEETPVAPPAAETDADDAFAPLPASGRVGDDGDARERTEAFLVELLLNVDPAYAVEVTQPSDDEVSVEIHGGDAGRLIGKNGRTLAALEQIVNAVVNREEGSDVRVNVDVGGYKRRRDERLRQRAQAAADQVRAEGDEVELEPMTAAERRIVHLAVAADPDVASESTGQGRDRRVVLKPA